MTMLTVEGVFENGRIRLSDNVALPEHTKSIRNDPRCRGEAASL